MASSSGPPIGIENLDDVAEDYGRWLIHGPQGSGKTTLAATIAEAGKTLFIDMPGEKGIRSFRGVPYKNNLKVVRPKSVTELDDLFWWLNGDTHDYQAVVIDSLTSVQKQAMRFLLGHDESAVREIRRGTAPATFSTWGQSLDIMVDIATFWFGLADGHRKKPLHVIMTAQTKVKEDELSGMVSRTPDVQPGALSILMASPDYILYTDTEENIDYISDDTAPPVHHIVRFGSHPGYRTKARLPFHLRGKIPPILGRRQPVSLVNLSRVLNIGGIPAADASTTKKEK